MNNNDINDGEADELKFNINLGGGDRESTRSDETKSFTHGAKKN